MMIYGWCPKPKEYLEEDRFCILYLLINTYIPRKIFGHLLLSLFNSCNHVLYNDPLLRTPLSLLLSYQILAITNHQQYVLNKSKRI